MVLTSVVCFNGFLMLVVVTIKMVARVLVEETIFLVVETIVALKVFFSGICVLIEEAVVVLLIVFRAVVRFFLAAVVVLHAVVILMALLKTRTALLHCTLTMHVLSIWDCASLTAHGGAV